MFTSEIKVKEDILHEGYTVLKGTDITFGYLYIDEIRMIDIKFNYNGNEYTIGTPPFKARVPDSLLENIDKIVNDILSIAIVQQGRGNIYDYASEEDKLLQYFNDKSDLQIKELELKYKDICENIYYNKEQICSIIYEKEMGFDIIFFRIDDEIDVYNIVKIQGYKDYRPSITTLQYSIPKSIKDSAIITNHVLNSIKQNNVGNVLVGVKKDYGNFIMDNKIEVNENNVSNAIDKLMTNDNNENKLN